MGYDIVAYFEVDQEKIEDFIVENNIDRRNNQLGSLVVDYYKEAIMAVSPDGTAFENPEMKDLDMNYDWDEECQTHKIYDSFGTNFIRDDIRFYDTSLPYCLTGLLYNLHTAEDAIEIADALEEHFEQDYNLMGFADWLRTTAKYCDVYKLSR